MVYAIELLILIVLFTVTCTFNCRDVDAHLDWVALNYPPQIVQRLIDEKRIDIPKTLTLKERVIKKLPILIIFIILLSLIVYFVNGCTTFMSAFLTCFSIWTIVDWYDAFILDCLWFCHSKKVRVSGTEDMIDAYHDYWFHIKGSLNGMLLGLIVSLIVGAIIQIV